MNSKSLLSLWAKKEKWFSLGCMLITIAIPFIISSPYIINICTLCLIYILLTISLNLVTGNLGITSLGHAAFFGIGAYTAAILSTRFGINFLLTSLCAGIIAAFTGLLIGAPTLRISGRYLVIVTLGIVEITRIIEINWMGLTRGPLGIMMIPAPNLFGLDLDSPIGKYCVVLAMVILTIILISNLLNSRIGRAISAVKGDELAAGAMGINTTLVKLVVFIISAAIAGFAGAFYAHYMSYIDPTSFTAEQSIQILSMIILGGLGSIPGAILGAITLIIIPELLREFLEVRLFIYGLIIVIMVLFKPKGLLGGINLKHIRQREQFEKAKGGLRNA